MRSSTPVRTRLDSPRVSFSSKVCNASSSARPLPSRARSSRVNSSRGKWLRRANKLPSPRCGRTASTVSPSPRAMTAASAAVVASRRRLTRPAALRARTWKIMKVRARLRSLPVHDIRVFTAAAGLAIAAEGPEVVFTMLARRSVLVGMAPGIVGQALLQVRPLPAGFA